MENRDERDINVYTDGSSYPGPRRAGIGILYVTVDGDGQEQVCELPQPGYDNATNQQAELAACIEALQALGRRRPPVDPIGYRRVVVWTDSMYLVENYARALGVWRANRWMTRDGNPVANAAQWKELLKAVRRIQNRVEIKWVKGHGRSAYNKAADKLAKRSADERTGRHLSVVKVRKKHTDASVDPGCVKMEGQRITIRVITDSFEPVQRMNKYKYEVVSRNSPYRRLVDLIFSDEDIQLSAGHTYYVKVNDDTRAPRVVKLFREVGL
jgi:ribonuclease HI